jgi:hypothetical protein
VGFNCHIFIFDNSDTKPFRYKQDNIVIYDNTEGKIINFDKELSKYPNRFYSLGAKSKWGSFKHCLSVDKCFDLIKDNFILLDSDVLLKKDISELYDDNYMSGGEIQDWSWGSRRDKYPVHKRLLPFLTFINVKESQKEGIRYFNPDFMDGLYDSTHENNPVQMNKDSYDTGCWFYEKIQDKPIIFFNCDDYIVHFRGGSYMKYGRNENLTQEQWLNKYKHLYKDKAHNVVYTCITGNYDSLIEPQFITPDYDYICYTDNPNLTSVNWEIREMPKATENLDNIRKNRYIKLHPHLLLSDYHISVYVDGCISIKEDLSKFVSSCDLQTNEIAIPTHPLRQCIYEEAKACVSCKKDTFTHINPQIQRYKTEGFPNNYGLTQNNVMVRKHNSEKCIKVMEEWWKEILNGSYRDQLSLMYVLWKNPDINIKKLPADTVNSQYFTWYSNHPKRKMSYIPSSPQPQPVPSRRGNPIYTPLQRGRMNPFRYYRRVDRRNVMATPPDTVTHTVKINVSNNVKPEAPAPPPPSPTTNVPLTKNAVKRTDSAGKSVIEVKPSIRRQAGKNRTMATFSGR